MSPSLMRAFSRFHTRLYRVSRGRLAATTAQGAPVLLLTTRGRRTGRARTTPLAFFRDGSRLVVCGGSGGTPDHPAWFLNLRAQPRVRVQIGAEVCAALAREAEGAERRALWQRAVDEVPLVVDYQARTKRRVPVVVLEPSDSAEGQP